MIIDKLGKLFEDRRKTERRKENLKVEQDKRNTERRKVKNKK